MVFLPAMARAHPLEGTSQVTRFNSCILRPPRWLLTNIVSKFLILYNNFN